MKLAKRLLEVYRENKIEETLKESDSWEMLYHLSPMRQNLLEWYEINDGVTVLEIGAEAGGLTDFWATRADSVVALEIDEEFLSVNQEKNKEFSNIDFRVGTINAIKETEKFDYITLIGTLEKGFMYCESAEPFDELLKICKKHLTEDGTIIIAGDNKTGMRYWAGAPENSSEVPFTGITSDVDVRAKRSFSKTQYENMLENAGFKDVEFYYPTPDYRFVSSVFSDDYLPQEGELRPGNGVYVAGGYQFFEEDLAYDTVCRDGEYPYFAESFLIFAKNSK